MIPRTLAGLLLRARAEHRGRRRRPLPQQHVSPSLQGEGTEGDGGEGEAPADPDDFGHAYVSHRRVVYVAGARGARVAGGSAVPTASDGGSSSAATTVMEGSEPAAELVRWMERERARSLLVVGRQFGDTGAQALATALQRNETLTELGVGASRMGPVGALALAESLRCHNFRLKALYINDEPRLGDEGGAAVARAVGDFFFGRYGKLQTLSLRGTAMGDRACEVLSEGLELNVRLKLLRLECNRIGDRGAVALGRALAGNVALVELDISENRVGTEGFVAIARGLRQNPKSRLVRLYAQHNFVQTRGALALERTLGTNRRIVGLRLGGNPIRPAVLARVARLARRNVEHAKMQAQLEYSRKMAETPDVGSRHSPTFVSKETGQPLANIKQRKRIGAASLFFDYERGVLVPEGSVDSSAAMILEEPSRWRRPRSKSPKRRRPRSKSPKRTRKDRRRPRSPYRAPPFACNTISAG